MKTIQQIITQLNSIRTLIIHEPSHLLYLSSQCDDIRRQLCLGDPNFGLKIRLSHDIISLYSRYKAEDSMLIKEACLERIAAQRTDEIVVTTMGMTAPWGEISEHPLDFASVGSAMGHAADFALGIALAKPEKKVVVLNGDGSMLMCLGTLATITGLEQPPKNYLLFVCDNGTYEVTGNQPVPRNADFSWTTIAKGTGFEHVYEFDQIDKLETDLPKVWSQPGPVFVNLRIAQADEPPPDRWGGFPYPYLQESLATSTHKLRKALEN